MVNSPPIHSSYFLLPTHQLAFISFSSFLFSSTDVKAADPRIDELRAKITCVEDPKFSVEYHAPDKRSIGNALLITLKDGTVLDEVEVEYPVGHKRRRTEGTPLLMAKFERHISHHFDAAKQKERVFLLLSYVDERVTNNALL